MCRVRKRPMASLAVETERSHQLAKQYRICFRFFFLSSFFITFSFRTLRYISREIRKSRGIFNQLAQNEDRVRWDRRKKIEFVHWLRIDVSANVPSTCRANKPVARFAQRCKAHLKLKGFPRDGATLRRMHGIRNTRKSSCVYTISRWCRGNYEFGHYVAQPKLRRHSTECRFDAILSNPRKWVSCDSSELIRSVFARMIRCGRKQHVMLFLVITL